MFTDRQTDKEIDEHQNYIWNINGYHRSVLCMLSSQNKDLNPLETLKKYNDFSKALEGVWKSTLNKNDSN